MQPSRHEELLAEKRKPPQTQDDCALKADHMGCCKLCPRPGSHSELVSQGQGGRRTAPTRLSCNRSKKQACLRKPSTHERKEREWSRITLQGDGQWLRCCVPNAGGPGSIPGQGTRFHMLHKDLSHMKILHATGSKGAGEEHLGRRHLLVRQILPH
ncbi:PREDICTED: uncharacterized protein LOC108636724 isoform X4 [Capra hircus]|uniref:uncharacterized protein LOC108636724 isoform X4 n=1 Tax=Capra hircus TaxID=9925 RepID=UPI000847314A|nr:PREDICTED: uncharacterized protein LOC108636724 isoform X4 [Capra hircus]